MFVQEDARINRVLRILNLQKPRRKIECYIYKDIDQKYCLSATPGYGNPLQRAWQNHSIGFPAVEHESIHILFDNQVAGGNLPTFLSEGVIGYYYATVDSMKWRQDRIFVTQHPNSPVRVEARSLASGQRYSIRVMPRAYTITQLQNNILTWYGESYSI